MDSLAPKAKVKRAGQRREIESADLVPGDMISFNIGDIVPADCRLTEPINVSIDQAAFTGESLPQNKKTGDQCFSYVFFVSFRDIVSKFRVSSQWLNLQAE